jgi:hypothetical protein
MTNRVLILFNRALDTTTRVMSTPSGVAPHRLRTYGRNSRDGQPHYFGTSIPD